MISICHPYPPSFHEMTCSTNFLLVVAKLERQGAPRGGSTRSKGIITLSRAPYEMYSDCVYHCTSRLL